MEPDLTGLTPTMDCMIELANNITGYIKKQQLDQAKTDLEKLYELGIQLVRNEVLPEKKITIGIVSPVVITLNEIAWNLIQHNSPFHRTLSKTYRLFMELTWFQCWKNGQRNTFSETKDKIIKCIEQVLSTLPKQFIDVRFEYDCAYAAAKCLDVPEQMFELRKTAPLVVALFTAGTTGAVSANIVVKCFDSMKYLVTNLSQEKPDMWFLDVHYLRWLSTIVFENERFFPFYKEIEKFIAKKNPHQNLCLATIFLDLMKSKDTKDGVKKLAVEELINLLGTEDQKGIVHYALGTWTNSEFLQSIAKQWDSYWEARALIIENINAILIEDHFIIPIIDVLVEKLSSVYQSEKEGARIALSTLKTRYSDNGELIDYLEGELIPGRGAAEVITEEFKQQLQEAFDKSKDVQNEIIKLILEDIKQNRNSNN